MNRAIGRTRQHFVPVEAKLRPPPPREDLAVRGLLVDRLIESADVPLVVVAGPPGYGKTVAVAQWQAVESRPFAWISLERGDDDPRVLLTYLAQALRRIGVLDLLVDDTDDTGLPGVALQLCRAMRRSRSPFVLVLDGTDALVGSVARQIVASLADHIPSHSQLVLVGRAAPTSDWSELRPQNRRIDIGATDLRLSRQEGLALAELTGAHLAPQAVEVLLERTEGWAAGMYLAVVSAAKDSSGDASASSGTGDDVGSGALIADYLRDELLLKLAPSEQQFLRRTSILSVLSGPLCDAVVGDRHSSAMLRRLARESMVLPYGDSGRRFRVHHLLAEALRAELGRLEPQQVKPLHSRASRWLEAHGDLPEAIRHAIAAGEVERSARLIWLHLPACLSSGRIDILEDWLDAFTRQQVISHAKLALTAAWCALQRGSPADHWISAAERGHYDAARAGESLSVAAAVTLLHAVVARNGVVQMGADARLAMSLRADETAWNCLAAFLEAVATYLTSGPGDARERLDEIALRAGAIQQDQTRAAALAQLALIAADSDDWSTAGELVEQARTVMRENALDETSLLVLVPCLESLISAHRDRVIEAQTMVRRSTRALALIVELPSWLGIQCRLVIGRTQLLLGDAAGTRTVLSEAQTLLRGVPDASVLQRAAEQAWRQVEQLPIEVASGVSAVTTAELRVLQLLPTYLSFEEIGRQLFVSRNTVKTQAISAYRKLGVTSRAEAVERAYAMGLISR